MVNLVITSGSATVPDFGTLEVAGQLTHDDAISFPGASSGGPTPTGTLLINDITLFRASVTNFSDGNRIVIGNLGITSITVTGLGDLPSDLQVVPAAVQVFDASGQIGTFLLFPTTGAGLFDGDVFTLTQDLDGKAILTTSHVNCLAAGTPVLTARGEVAVEDLREGDCVPTALGRIWRRVRWVGRRQVNIARHPRPWDVQPIRVYAHAFGQGMPRTDILLSPDHAVYVGAVLIPVRYLVNGATVVREAMDAVTYLHVELADAEGAAVHDVMLAGGLTVESFLDTGGRAAFANGGRVVMATPDFALRMWETAGCAPLVRDGARLTAARKHLRALAMAWGHALTSEPDVHLLLHGRRIEPRMLDGVYRFALPYAADRVRLVSRSYVPAETKPESDDTRRLGVAVTGLAFDGRPASISQTAGAEGWHAPEPGLCWTTGDAVIQCDQTRVLDVSIAGWGLYWSKPSTLGAVAA